MEELLEAFILERVVGHRGEVLRRLVGRLQPALLLLLRPLFARAVLAPEDLGPFLFGLALRSTGGGRRGELAATVNVLVNDLEGHAFLAHWAVD